MGEGEHDDLELLKAWHAGVTTAGNTLYRRHEAPLRRFFVSKAPPQDTDELVQQTWMAMTRNQKKAAAGATPAHPIQSVRAYILGVARHIVFAYYRKTGQKTEFDPEVDSLATIAPSVSQQLSLRRNIKRLELAMQTLPIDSQLLCEAFYIEEFTGPELAEMFNLPEGTVRSRIKRAKEKIDELMARFEIRMGKASV